MTELALVLQEGEKTKVGNKTKPKYNTNEAYGARMCGEIIRRIGYFSEEKLLAFGLFL